MKFFIHSRYGELLDLALNLQSGGHEILFYVPDKDYSLIGEGMVPTVKDGWFPYMGKGFIYVVDGCEDGKMQDWLRYKGELVCGGSEMGDKLENDRQLNQKWFRQAGFYQPFSKNFTDFDSATKFVEANRKNRFILKQNGTAPKHLNHMGKFPGGEDMLWHLKELNRGWTIQEYGEIDFDLMEIIDGVEVAASAFFNGKNFLHNKGGGVVGFLNFEEKKEVDGALGETTGELGTTFLGVTGTPELFKSILLRPKIVDVLRRSKFRGLFDINCISGPKGLTALEPTCRWGYPSTSYAMCEGLSNPGEVIEGMASGKEVIPQVAPGVGMVMCVVAKPFPLEADVEPESTSQGDRLWPLMNGKPEKDFTPEQKKHIHLYNFHRKQDMDTKEECYKVATKNGYLYTVTGRGDTIKSTREKLIKYIKDNSYLAGFKWRSDIGKRVEESAHLLKGKL